MSRQLSNMTPSALNMTAFPQNRRKRHLHSPNSPNSQNKKDMVPKYDDDDDDEDIDDNNNDDYDDDDNADDNADVDVELKNISYSSCSTPVTYHHLTKSNKILKNNTDTETTTTNSNNMQRVSLRRSTGLLNLSLEASPSTQRVINNSSKNDEMLKSFNELTFNNTNTSLDPKDALTIEQKNSTSNPSSTPSSSSNNISSTPRTKTVYKPLRAKYSSIFGTHNINNINHISTNRRGSDMQKKLERQLEHYKDKLSKKISPSKTELSPSNNKSQQQSTKKTKSFALNKILNTNNSFNNHLKSNNEINIYNDNSKINLSTKDYDIDNDLMTDDISPSKNAFNKILSTSSSSSINMSNPLSLTNRPITTGSISMSNSSSVTTSNSTSMIIPSTIHSSKSINSKFATPAAYKSVKPLQTAFTSTGLQSKNEFNIMRKSKHTVPETPCKKPPRVVDIDNIKLKNKSAPPTANTSILSNNSLSSSINKNHKNIIFNNFYF